MTKICPNMPACILLEDCDNDWNKYLDLLYREYLKDFSDENLIHKGNRVKTLTELDYTMRQQTFNHITTKGSFDRLYNKQRCERLKWIRPIIEGNCDECATFYYFPDLNWKKGKSRRYMLWCVDYDFVVILEQRNDVFFLITAYCIVYENKRKDLKNKYNQYLKTKSA